MTQPDDNHLIERLTDELTERRSTISAHDDIGDQARRTARRRTARRTVTAGVPVVAAAGVATVLLAGSGSGSSTARDTSAGQGNAASPVASAGAAKARNTAYVVQRVRAKLADDASAQGHSLRNVSYSGGSVNPDGTLVNLGRPDGGSWEYYTPDGAWWAHNTSHTDPGVTGISREDPVAHGHQRTTLTVLNARNKTYSVKVTDYKVPDNAPPPSPEDLGFGSAGSDVVKALRDGQATQLGTVEVNGIRTIALKVNLPASDQVDTILYVDARTYETVRVINKGTAAGEDDTFVTDMVPATPDTIAKAKDDTIPAGYTKVDHTAG